MARELLGKVLVRRLCSTSPPLRQDSAGLRGVKKVRAIITETEAYVGEQDLASHARFGRTRRTEAMYGEPGTVYMFFTYGVYWMLNIVCGKVGDPQAVLIRGADVTGDTAQVTRINGPGRLTKFLEVDGEFYGEDLITSERLWVEFGESNCSNVSKSVTSEQIEIVVTPRIGIDYAKEWKDKPLRFLLKEE